MQIIKFKDSILFIDDALSEDDAFRCCGKWEDHIETFLTSCENAKQTEVNHGYQKGKQKLLNSLGSEVAKPKGKDNVNN